VASLESAADLHALVARTGLFAGASPPEGSSWRPGEFRRFQIGTLPDGRPEWIDFWIQNHLLPPFEDLWARREEATERGIVVAS
jgi:hypothetical protein